MIKLYKWLKKLLRGLISRQKRNVRVYTQKTQVKDKVALNKLTEDKGVNLLLIRDTFTDKSVMGELFINGERICDTLELPWRDNQRSVSCIPAGEYKVRFRYPRESASRDYLHLLIKDVPNRDYILFHRGNTAKDSRGCVLVGFANQQDFVGNSTLAMDLLMKELINCGHAIKNINLIIKNK